MAMAVPALVVVVMASTAFAFMVVATATFFHMVVAVASLGMVTAVMLLGRVPHHLSHGMDISLSLIHI